MNLTNIRPDNLEKMMGLQWCLMLLSSILFIDCYLIEFYNISFVSVDINWIIKEMTTKSVIYFIVAFSISFSLVVPGLSLITAKILDAIFNKYFPSNKSIRERLDADLVKIEPHNYISPENLKSWSIRNSNYPAYEEYRFHQLMLSKQAFLETLCRTILILFYYQVNIGKDKEPIFKALKDWISEFGLMYQVLAHFILLFILMYFALIAFNFRNPYSNYIKINNHRIGKKTI